MTKTGKGRIPEAVTSQPMDQRQAVQNGQILDAAASISEN